ncbi:MAG: hypothetical protein WCG34_11055 [Leptolinea sp.]
MKSNTISGITAALKLSVAAFCLIPILGGIAASTHNIFNDGRLAPAFSILAGNPPYYPVDSGPILNTLYGPLSYFYYFPCAIFRQNISLAILFGSFLSFAAFAIPAGIILYRRRKNLGAIEILWLAALGVFQIIGYSSLTYSAFSIHADAPAVLFSSLCVLLLDQNENGITSPRALFLSAVFGVVTIWTKQSFAPVVLLPMAVALAEKQTWRLRIALAGWIGFLTGLLFIIFAMWCGTEALIDNFVRIARAYPSLQASFLFGPEAGGNGHFKSVVIAAHIIVGKYLTPYILCLAAFILLLSLKDRRTTGESTSFYLPRLPRLFFLLALLNLPMSASAALITGAGGNSETPFAWFFILGIFCLVVECKAFFAPAKIPTANSAIYYIFTGLALVALFGTVRHLPTAINNISRAFDNDESAIVEICRRSPGKYYFPWNPLAGYFGEGKFYHYQHMVEARFMGAKPPNIQHFNQFIPPQASVVGLPKETAGETGSASETRFLGTYLEDLTLCNNPTDVTNGRFVWFSFVRKP